MTKLERYYIRQSLDDWSEQLPKGFKQEMEAVLEPLRLSAEIKIVLAIVKHKTHDSTDYAKTKKESLAKDARII